MSLSQRTSISGMVNQSVDVLTKPSVMTFERYERGGTVTSAAIYVGIIALITGLLGFAGGFGAVVGNVISTLIGFFVFTGLVYYVGRQQGGSGTFDEVAYTFSLFWGPLALVFALISLVLLITVVGIVLLPLLGLLAIAANIYFAYLAIQSSMNLLDRNKIWITLAAAAIGSFIVQLIITRIF